MSALPLGLDNATFQTRAGRNPKCSTRIVGRGSTLTAATATYLSTPHETTTLEAKTLGVGGNVSVGPIRGWDSSFWVPTRLGSGLSTNPQIVLDSPKAMSSSLNVTPASDRSDPAAPP